ncbi:MAG: hypothetical protein IPP90_15890 [Gemmatimonadaceae bacterium]|nr:hypothetical protein [Gemmatimonadaceae bacterium]
MNRYRGKFDLNADRYGVLLLEHLFVGNGLTPASPASIGVPPSLALARLSPRPAHIASVRRFTHTPAPTTSQIPSGAIRGIRGAFITSCRTVMY